ncbi:MAG: cation-transporting P-type ATPase, partial [Nanoarchaeota archaeon]|nr:cation-transporting P-type ATPase [Nanoarchaeota archaeon]
DKTGTITKGEMTIKKIFCNDDFFDVSGIGYDTHGNVSRDNIKVDTKKIAALNLLLKTAVLCNDANIERKGEDSEYATRGTPTEVALLIMAAKAGIFKEDLNFTRNQEIPFNSNRKIMSVLCKEKSGKFVYSKGAPEIIINNCKYMQKNNKVIKINEREKKKILKLNTKFTMKKFRVLALAYKQTASFEKDHFEQDLVFLGLVALEDPPRVEVKSALKLCKHAGIDVKMITGDNKETAIEIAKEIGLRGNVLIDEELDKLTDDELSKIVKGIVIFARVKPEHKLRIVRALKQNKEIVAMTGDGVNDAPALREAHIGIAMGKGGTDVSREAADLTLKDNNFVTIISAISEGRTIFNNIRKFITYQLSCNCAELFVIFFGILIGLPLPLLALQILFMNLITDDLPALTLGFNPASRDVMKSKPRKESRILNKQLIKLLIVSGSIMGIITLGTFYFALNILHLDIVTARTIALVTLIFIEIANAFNFRSFRYPVHKLPLLANKYLVYASIASIVATLLIIYTPLNIIFETTPISWYYFVSAALMSLIIVIIFDIWKIFKGDLLDDSY